MDKNTINKRRIINDSIHVMYLKGYNSTSVKELADAAGIPKGSFYYYFKSKEEYAVGALDFYMDELGRERFMLLETAKAEPLDRIRNFYKSKIENMENEAYKLGCFVGNLSQEMGDVNMVISEATDRLHKKTSEKVLKCIMDAQEKHNFKPILPANKLANAIITHWQGALLRMKSSRDREPLDEFFQVLQKVFLKDNR